MSVRGWTNAGRRGRSLDRIDSDGDRGMAHVTDAPPARTCTLARGLLSPSRRRGGARQQTLRGPPDQIGRWVLARQRVGEVALDAEREGVGRRQAQAIAHIGEAHQAGDRMIAVGVNRPDVQEQIDLGGGETGRSKF